MLNRSIKTIAGTVILTALLGAVLNSFVYAQEQDRVTQLDVLFVNDVAWSTAAEISISQIARQFAVRPETRQYAQRMVNEHTEALNELIQLANDKAILLPAEIVNSRGVQPQRIAPNQLGNARERFDVVYLMGQMEMHEKMVELFQSEVVNGGDAGLRAYAAKYQPIVEEHLRLARRTLFALIGTNGTPPTPDTPQQ